MDLTPWNHTMTHKTTQPTSSPQIASFEDGLATLGDLVARLESGGLGLSESIEAYERGVGILRQLNDELARADARVRLLVRIDEDGQPILADHETDTDSSAAIDRGPSRRRTRGKTSRGQSLPGMDDRGEEA
jgi:exodeoxyribonuclease VII small subunit